MPSAFWAVLRLLTQPLLPNTLFSELSALKKANMTNMSFKTKCAVANKGER